MMKKIVLPVVGAILIAASLSFAAPVNMKEGKWEIVTSINMEGVPFPMPPMKTTHCYTKKDLASNASTLPSGSSKKNDCEIQDQKVSGNTVTWTTVCKDGSRGSGEASYKGSSYTATMKMTAKDGGASTTTIRAKRIGDCK